MKRKSVLQKEEQAIFDHIRQKIFVDRAAGGKDVFIKSKMHYHDSYEIYFLLDGDRDYIIDGKVFNIKKDSIVLIAPYCQHQTIGYYYDRILVHFNESSLRETVTQKTLEDLIKSFDVNVVQIADEYREKVKDTFFKLLDCSKNNTPMELLSLYVAELMLLIKNYSRNTERLKQRPQYTNSQIIPILEYINKNYSKITGIQQIADQFFLNKYYLCHLFKKTTGTTLISHLTNIRIQNALKQLKSTKKSITQIAVDCGFNTSTYFCKVFCGNIGMTPKEYRKLNSDVKVGDY